jgi:hypothetical protein
MTENINESMDSSWRSLYRIGAAAALTAVLTGIAEIVITFLPGGGMSSGTLTAIDWFTLFQNNPFLGLRNLGLLNIILTSMEIPVFFALYAAHRRIHKAFGALAMIIAFIGLAVFLATNRAFPMLDLSGQYAAATTEAQQSLLAAAGQTMLAVGKSHTPGTFLGFLLSEVAGIVISIVMLRSKVFSQASAYVGILGFSLLLIFEVCSSFFPALRVSFIFAMGGGLLSLTWYVLIAIGLFQLSRQTKRSVERTS